MDGSTLEHSDSDSGESWTLLENSPIYGDDAPDGAVDPTTNERLTPEVIDKDEDTDGISIISDSDPESTTPCELTYDHCVLEEKRPTDTTPLISVTPLPTNNAKNEESIREVDDILGDNNKHKTYVHRRNKRLSTVLNIIVLGSVITAAGVAIGHMWGARNDCLNSAPSVNKILSNLYKLQEENGYLRNKIKELTLVANLQQQRKINEKPPLNKHKCKKVFEESLTNKNVDKLTKCVDNETAQKALESHMIQPQFEKDFLHDIDKLKNVYQQNKSWLDEEIEKRLSIEQQQKNKMQKKLTSPKSIKINEEFIPLKTENLRRQLATEPPVNNELVINVTEPSAPAPRIIEVVDNKPEKRITYADSLKSSHKVVKRDTNEAANEINKNYAKKRKALKEFDTISENSFIDDVIKKDDRYVTPKYKPDRKKGDRHKMHKKQKRRNKYEQWEMKGGYMKDYDDFSIPSAYENEYVLKSIDKNNPSRDFERNNYISQFSESGDKKKSGEGQGRVSELGPDNGAGENRTAAARGLSWYEQRAALRSSARSKLQRELFGDSSDARWYFRRMQRREQCRVARDNATHRRRTQRARNYKTKH